MHTAIQELKQVYQSLKKFLCVHPSVESSRYSTSHHTRCKCIFQYLYGGSLDFCLQVGMVAGLPKPRSQVVSNLGSQPLQNPDKKSVNEAIVLSLRCVEPLAHIIETVSVGECISAASNVMPCIFLGIRPFQTPLLIFGHPEHVN